MSSQRNSTDKFHRLEFTHNYSQMARWYSCLPSGLHQECRTSPCLVGRKAREWGALHWCFRVLGNVSSIDCAQLAPPFWPSTSFTTVSSHVNLPVSELPCLGVASFGTQLTVCIKFDCQEPELFLLLNNVKMESLAFISVSPELALVTSK